MLLNNLQISLLVLIWWKGKLFDMVVVGSWGGGGVVASGVRHVHA